MATMTMAPGGTRTSMANEAVISTRSRNLAFGWTTKPVTRYNSSGQSYSEIDMPAYPGEQAGIKTVHRQMDEHSRICSGGVWSNSALFVGGRRVKAVWTYGVLRTVPAPTKEDPHAEDEVYGMGWFTVHPREILNLLTDSGNDVRVLLATSDEE